MEIKGKVLQSLGLQQGVSKAGKAWSRAEIIIETTENPQYPKKVRLANMKDSDKFAMLTPGAEGIFSVEIESREFNGKWYTDVNCWKWNITGNEAAGYTTVQQGQPQQPQQYPQQPSQQYQQSPYPTAQPYQRPQQQAQPFGGQVFPQNPQPQQQTDDLPF